MEMFQYKSSRWSPTRRKLRWISTKMIHVFKYKISNGSISLIENFIILHFLTHLTFSLCVASIYKFLILEIKMPKLYACIIWHQNAKLQRGERRKRCYNSAPQRSPYPERIFDRGGNRVSRDSMLRNIVERIVLTEEKQRGREYRVFLAAYRARMDHSSVHPWGSSSTMAFFVYPRYRASDAGCRRGAGRV